MTGVLKEVEKIMRLKINEDKNKFVKFVLVN